VFLASVAEEAMSNVQRTNYDIVGFLLVKKLLQMIDYLKSSLVAKANIFNLEYWIIVSN
jgi:serine/threonine-protein kinase ULK/ATG1